MPQSDKIKITMKELDELYEVVDIEKPVEIKENQTNEVDTSNMTYEETISYHDTKLIKEFKEE